MADSVDVLDAKFVIVGGGISGVTCAETVSRRWRDFLCN